MFSSMLYKALNYYQVLTAYCKLGACILITLVSMK